MGGGTTDVSLLSIDEGKFQVRRLTIFHSAIISGGVFIFYHFISVFFFPYVCFTCNALLSHPPESYTAPEHFDGPCIATDQPTKLQLRKALHALLPFGLGPAFSCLFRWHFLRQFTSMAGASVSFLRAKMVPVHIGIPPLVAKY